MTEKEIAKRLECAVGDADLSVLFLLLSLV